MAHLGRNAKARVRVLRHRRHQPPAPAIDHASDFRTCLACGAELAYAAVLRPRRPLALRRLRQPRPAPDVRVTRVALARMPRQRDRGRRRDAVTLPLAGLYNAYNALAAAAGARRWRCRATHRAALDGFSAAFGRQERFRVGGRDVQVLLGKNPTGLNQVLRRSPRSPACAAQPDAALLILSSSTTASPTAATSPGSGTPTTSRCSRRRTGRGSRYPRRGPGAAAEVRGIRRRRAVERETAAALQRALDATPAGGTLYVVPTYTAMLEVRELLAKRVGACEFWEAHERPVLRVAHLYPRLMNIYGDRGNIMCLRRRCEARGIGFELTELGLGDRLDPAVARPDLRGRRAGPRAARRRRRPAGDEGGRPARGGGADVVVLAVCGGYQLVGRYYREASGNRAGRRRDLRPVHRAPRSEGEASDRQPGG